MFVPLKWLGLIVCLAIASATFFLPPSETSVVLEGRLFDSTTGQVLDDGVVVISGQRIACSGKRAACDVPDGAVARRFDDAMILPGLIDLHVHARPHYLGAFLPSGVTTIRDANNTLGVVEEMRQMHPRPRLIASGPLLDFPDSVIGRMSETAGFLGDHPLDELTPVFVTGREQAVASVEALAESGVDFIKLYATLDHESFEAAVAAADARDLRVAADLGMLFTQGLSGASVDIVQAAQTGVASIEHVSGLALAYERRGGDPYADAIDDQILDAIADDLLDTDVAVVPTLANLVQFSDPGSLSLDGLPGSDLLPTYFEDHWRDLLGWSQQAREQFVSARRLKEALLVRLFGRGMMIGAGSDLPAAPYMLPGSALHLELEAMVMAGMTPVGALQAATTHGAAILGQEDLGHLGRGAHADVLVVEGDPTRVVTDSRNVLGVWMAGEEIDLEAAWRVTEEHLRDVSQK